MLGDRETGSYWQHLTGLCLHGPLQGKKLPVFSLPRLTAGQAQRAFPGALLAFSRLSLAQRVVVGGQKRTLQLLNGRLPPGFQWTMGQIDTRLPLMARGLAAWTERWQRFYPLKTLRARGNALIDAYHDPPAEGEPAVRRRIVVGIDPVSGTPFCLPTFARACNWCGDTLVLDVGGQIHGTVLRDAQGTLQPADRFLVSSTTCWYSFSFTFPGGEIYV